MVGDGNERVFNGETSRRCTLIISHCVGVIERLSDCGCYGGA